MAHRYHVEFAGPRITITESPDGPWPRWEMATAAAAEHLEDQVQECQKMLGCLRRAGNFWGYELLREEREALVATV